MVYHKNRERVYIIGINKMYIDGGFKFQWPRSCQMKDINSYVDTKIQGDKKNIPKYDAFKKIPLKSAFIDRGL